MNERTNERRLIDGTVKGEKEGRKERKKENLNSAAEKSTAAVMRL